MLVIRREQLAIFGQEYVSRQQEPYTDRIQQALGTGKAEAERVFALANRFGLETLPQWLSLAAICREQGFDWQGDPKKRWIHEYLSDSRVSSAADRVRRVERELERRKRTVASTAAAVARYRQRARS